MNSLKYIRRYVLCKTMDDLAEMIGVSKSAISMWENSKAPLPVKRKQQLSEMTGIPEWAFELNVIDKGSVKIINDFAQMSGYGINDNEIMSADQKRISEFDSAKSQLLWEMKNNEIYKKELSMLSMLHMEMMQAIRNVDYWIMDNKEHHSRYLVKQNMEIFSEVYLENMRLKRECMEMVLNVLKNNQYKNIMPDAKRELQLSVNAILNLSKGETK